MPHIVGLQGVTVSLQSATPSRQRCCLPETALGHRVREERERYHWNTSELARRAGVSESYLGRVERGEVASPGIEQVEKIARALALTTDELTGAAHRLGPRTISFGSVVLVPEVNVTISAGEAGYTETGDAVPVPIELARAPRRLCASKVRGACMEPEIMDGDMVIVDLADTSPRPGDLVAALLESGELMVKRYDRRGGRPVLIDNQGATYPVDGALIQGVIISSLRKYR